MFAEPNNQHDMDQTQFGSEGVFFDANKPAPLDPNAPKPKFWQSAQGRMVLAVMAIVAVILVLVSFAWFLQPEAASTTEPTEEETVTETMDLGPLGEKAKALRTQLRAADPSKELDPQPPINIELRLDPVKE